MSQQKKKKGANRRGKTGQMATDGDRTAFTEQYSATNDLVIWKNPRSKDPFPQRFRTVMHTAIQGSVPVGTSSNLYFVRGNSAYLPFVGGAWGSGLPGIGTLNPTGYSNLVNNNFFYKWRVMSSKIRVQFAPQAAVDTIVVTVTPSFNSATPASTQAALTQQFTKYKTIGENQPESSQTITSEMHTHRLLGVRRQAILDDLSGQFFGNAASTPANVWAWVVNFQVIDAAVSINKIPYTCEVMHEIELFGDSTAADLETVKEVPLVELSSAQLLSA